MKQSMRTPCQVQRLLHTLTTSEYVTPSSSGQRQKSCPAHGKVISKTVKCQAACCAAHRLHEHGGGGHALRMTGVADGQAVLDAVQHQERVGQQRGDGAAGEAAGRGAMA